MEFSLGEIVVWLVVGALTGPVVGLVVKRNREGFGRWRNLGIGLAGALIGGLLFKLLHIDLGLDSFTIRLQDLIAAFVGAVLFLLGIALSNRREFYSGNRG